MKFPCLHCHIRCKSTLGLNQHIRTKHNHLTYQNGGISGSSKPEIDFPTHRDSAMSSLMSVNTTKKRKQSCENDDSWTEDNSTGGQIIDSEEALRQHDRFLMELGLITKLNLNNPLHP
jgi:hypothetical protein